MTTYKFEFEKQGIKFFFRNPTWNDFYQELRMEWKVEGVKENKKNDGYYCNSTFVENKGAMALINVKINDKGIAGVTLPEDIAIKVKALYNKFKDESLQKKLTSDIQYRMNDNTAYGIYNGISESQIKPIIYDIVKQNNSTAYINIEKVVRILNDDEEIKQIADETYTPYPLHDNPSEEWKEKYPEWVKNKVAEGCGTIPNYIIRQKLTPILLDLIKKDNIEKAKEEEEKKASEERYKKFTIKKVYRHVNPSGGECGTDGYYDADITDGSNTIRFVARNVFDFGYYTYPKRLEGTDGVFKEENWTEMEIKVSEWLTEFSPFTTHIRM